MAMATTTAARTKRSTPLMRAARRSESLIAGIHCERTVAAERVSTRLSEPNASMAGLWAVKADQAETPSSTSIQASVMSCRRIPDERVTFASVASLIAASLFLFQDKLERRRCPTVFWLLIRSAIESDETTIFTFCFFRAVHCTRCLTHRVSRPYNAALLQLSADGTRRRHCIPPLWTVQHVSSARTVLIVRI